MRHNLAKVLLLVMTISSIVMPIHAYAHELTETQDSPSIKIDSSHGTGSVTIPCDHCCHFSSHSLGLMRVSSKFGESPDIYISTIYRQNYSSVNQPPPYHPPIA